MKVSTKAQVITIYIGEDEKWHSGLLYPAIIERFLQADIAGVTALHGSEGYGSHHKLHTTRFENLFGLLPIVIQAVDVPEKIAIARAIADEMICEGLVTFHDVEAVHYSLDPKPK